MNLLSRIFDRVTHSIRWFFLKRLPTCKDLTPLMSESLERRLTLRERAVLQLHLYVCIWCVWYLRQLERIREAGLERGEADARGESEPSATLSDEARDRIRRALEDAQ